MIQELKNENGEDKTVIIITVDGGPDENPRYKKTVTCAIEYFNSYDLDAVFVATNAPKEKRHHRFPLQKVSEVSSGQARTVEEPYI